MITRTGTGITFQVEQLERATEKIGTKSQRTIFHSRVQEDVTGEILDYPESAADPDFPSNILAVSDGEMQLVDYGDQSFFSCMYQAFAEHRPFVFSPDIIWLLISQGFAQHVNANAEALRHHFVGFDGKMDLVNEDRRIHPDIPDSPWEEMFPAFMELIKMHTGPKLVDALTADFSTTGLTERIASQITIMESMKSYFNFIQMYAICGIPEITLEGTEADWKKLREKAASLRTYELGWWIDELDPLLEQFVQAAAGNPDVTFWQRMFRIKTEWDCGQSGLADGWILHFFPYDSDGKKRSGPIEIYRGAGVGLPNEIVKVDVKFIEQGFGEADTREIPLEVWAGFVGAEQHPETLALKPKIGWMIRKKDVAGNGMLHQLEKEIARGWDINLAVEVVPEEIIKVKTIEQLGLYFKEEIKIPDAMKTMQISQLTLEGRIDRAGVFRVLRLLPASHIYLNDAYYPAFLPMRFPGVGVMRFGIGKLRSRYRRLRSFFR